MSQLGRNAKKEAAAMHKWKSTEIDQTDLQEVALYLRLLHQLGSFRLHN